MSGAATAGIGTVQVAGLLAGSARPEPGVRGGVALRRLPVWVRTQHDDALLGWAERCPAGARLRFVTAASAVRLRLVTTVLELDGGPVPPPGRVAMVVGAGSAPRVVDLPPGDVVALGPDLTPRDHRPADVAEVTLDLGSGRDPATPVEVWLPHDRAVELVSVDADAPVAPAPAAGAVRWVHHGSSISHGLEAPSPDRRWPAQVALRRGWDLHDLSFSGNAQLDPFAARMIRDTPADLVTLKVGINLVNADSMRRRTMLPALHGFLDTVREGHPTTPVVLITAIACPAHEDAPGPVVVDPGTDRARAAHRDVEADAGALTLAATREVVAAVHRQRAAQDPHLHLVDGLSLLGPDDAHLLHDGLHPSPAGLDLVAARFLDADLPLLGDRGL